MSLPDGLNTVKLGYGEFGLLGIAQDAGGNLVTCAAADIPIVGDYFYSTGNTNGTATFVRVTELISITVFRINYTGGVGSVLGGNFSKCKQIDVYFSDNENIMLKGKRKTKIDKTILENLIGYRTILNITTEPLSSAQKSFMYQFAKSDLQRAEVFSVVYSDVVLQDQQLIMDLIENYIEAVGITIELHERDITISGRAYALGTTNSSGYNASMPLGTRVKLTMNWGDGEVSRNFCCNLANIYSIQIEKKDYEYWDEGYGKVTFGFRPMCQIDFGTFGFNATPQDICDDIAWIKNFSLAPSKYIDVYEVFQTQVANDFEEIRVNYLDGFVYAKMLSLSFIGKSIQDNQVSGTGIFTLEDDTLGILDTGGELG